MHRNPVLGGLVASPEGWRGISYRSSAYGEPALVRINWTWWEDKFGAPGPRPIMLDANGAWTTGHSNRERHRAG
jgi:hypothetical protein